MAKDSFLSHKALALFQQVWRLTCGLCICRSTAFWNKGGKIMSPSRVLGRCPSKKAKESTQTRAPIWKSMCLLWILFMDSQWLWLDALLMPLMCSANPRLPEYILKRKQQCRIEPNRQVRCRQVLCLINWRMEEVSHLLLQCITHYLH